MAKHGKKYNEVAKKVDHDKNYLPAEALQLVKDTSYAKFIARVAQESGADFVIGDDEGLKKIQDGWTDWDVSIAMADMMGKAGRLGKVLGPRGLMPSPKAGNITQSANDLPRMITEAKAGRVEFRVDKTAGVHVPIGKATFTHQQLMQNFAALMDALKKAKPSAAKGIYIKKISLAATMGPGVRVDPNAAQSMESSG